MQTRSYVTKDKRQGVWNGRWRARLRLPDGSWKSQSFGTRREADDWLHEQVGHLKTGTYVDPKKGSLTYGEFLEAGYWVDLHMKPSARYSRESIIRSHLLPKWGTVPLGAITHEAVQRWVVELISWTKVTGGFGEEAGRLPPPHLFRRSSAERNDRRSTLRTPAFYLRAYLTMRRPLVAVTLRSSSSPVAINSLTDSATSLRP